ncbi:MAG: hypothetical protein AAGK00_17790 [Pseudomonadota bacterium]
MSVAGSVGSALRSTVVFGFAKAFSGNFVDALGLVCDQANALSAPDRLDDPSWNLKHTNVDTVDTRPGPFGVALQRVWGSDGADGYIEGPTLGTVAPYQRAGFAVIVGDPTAAASAIALDSPAGLAEVRISWADTPPLTTLMGMPCGLAAKDGGVSDLGGGLYRVWITAENQSGSELPVKPLFYISRGLANAGLKVGAYVGAAMATVGHLGTGFCLKDTLPGRRGLAGIDPAEALVSASGILPDLRPLEGGALEGRGSLSGQDILGRGRLAPDTAGAFTLNPAPRFLGESTNKIGLRRAQGLMTANSRYLLARHRDRLATGNLDQ